MSRGFDAWVTWCSRVRHLRVGIGRVIFRRGVVERGLLRRLVEGWRITAWEAGREMGGSSRSPGRYHTFSPEKASHSPEEKHEPRHGGDSMGLPPRGGGASSQSAVERPPSNVGGAGNQSSKYLYSSEAGGSQPAAGAGGSHQPSSPLVHHPLAPIIQSRRDSECGSAQGGGTPQRVGRRADEQGDASPQGGGRKVVREWLSPGGGDFHLIDSPGAVGATSVTELASTTPMGAAASPSSATVDDRTVDDRQPGASPSSLGWSSPPPVPRSPQKRWY